MFHCLNKYQAVLDPPFQVRRPEKGLWAVLPGFVLHILSNSFNLVLFMQPGLEVCYRTGLHFNLPQTEFAVEIPGSTG